MQDVTATDAPREPGAETGSSGPRTLRYWQIVARAAAVHLIAVAPIAVFVRGNISILTWVAAVFCGFGGGRLGVRSSPQLSRTAGLVLAPLMAAGAVLAARSATYPLALGIGAFACGGVAGLVHSWYGGLPLLSADDRGREYVAQMGAFIVAMLMPVWMAVPLAAVAGAVVVAVPFPSSNSLPVTRPRPLFALLWGALVLGALGWAGATNPAAGWLGPVTAHGPRGMNRVALTFDDGPNGDSTRAVMAALDERGVKSTFFLVGKAADREPDVARALVEDGHLAGGHSWHHDAWRFIEPAYPELARADASVSAAAGVCPRYYRPPHGTHTPFVWWAAHRAGERVVNWDVSATDWTATDSVDLARRIVKAARPGSIILLHDGLDGHAGVDRTVIARALPAIIDGLRAKGLEPVRLDELLGDRAYREGCGTNE